MMKKSRINPCLVFLNSVFACAGVGFIGVGVWLARNHGTNCVHFLQAFLVGVGLFMVGVAAAGLVGSFCRVVWLLYINFVVMLLLLLLLLGATVFVLAVTSHGFKAYVVSSERSKDPFSGWLLHKVNHRIKRCTQNGQICHLVDYTYANSYYNRPGFSSLQEGCCQPPPGCSTDALANATTMAMEADCEAWRKIGSEGFCSRCSSCRAAVAENIRHVWHQVAIFKVITLLLLVPSYFLTCCCFKQDDDDDHSHDRSCQECLNCFYSCLP